MIRRATISRSPKYPARYTSRYVLRVHIGMVEVLEFETEVTARLFEIAETIDQMVDVTPEEYPEVFGFASLKWPISDWTGLPEMIWKIKNCWSASWFDASGVEYEVNFE